MMTMIMRFLLLKKRLEKDRTGLIGILNMVRKHQNRLILVVVVIHLVVDLIEVPVIMVDTMVEVVITAVVGTMVDIMVVDIIHHLPSHTILVGQDQCHLF